MARLILAAALLLSLSPLALGVDLHIETRVYTPDEEKPASQSVTCLSDGVVYDFRPEASRVTIFRPAVGSSPARFVLLDTERELRTEVHSDQIAVTMSKLRRWAAMQSDPFLRFTGAPSFAETFDEQSGVLEMSSEQMSYRVTTTPIKHTEMGGLLKTFLDEYARLQTLLEAGLPPDPRLKVNEALYRRKVVPLKVELITRDDEEPALRAEHTFAWVISKGDRSRIDQALDQLASFRRVSNAEFHSARTALK